MSCVCEGSTSTVQRIMRRQFDSRRADPRSPARYDVMRELNVNEYLNYRILHGGVAGEGRAEYNEVLLCSL